MNNIIAKLLKTADQDVINDIHKLPELNQDVLLLTYGLEDEGPMTDEEIQWYIDTGEWHGAAGGYRIQSLASLFVAKIEGSYTGVVGLPISELYDILKEQGYSILE